jgi:hypothetical protein
MGTNNRSRTDLKAYFVTNAIPTQGQFGDLIDGVLNLKDDGIARPEGGSPLGIAASGEDLGERRVLQFFDKFTDGKSEWSLSLRPRVNPNTSSARRSGLAVADVDSKTRLFLDSATGNVGVGTVEPAARLHVAGDLRVDGDLRMGDGAFSIPAGRKVSGIQVIDFMELELDIGSFKNHAYVIRTGMVTFSQPVIKAQAVMRSYSMGFGAQLGGAEFYSSQFIPSCTIDGNNVNVSLKFGLHGTHDWRSGTATVLVIAVLENAV